MSNDTESQDDGQGTARRNILKCMLWAGTGVLWTVAGGVPRSLRIESAQAAAAAASSSLSFLQVSDSHIGFAKDANPDVTATLRVAVERINQMPVRPAFVLHTGDVTHLSKPEQFDLAAQVLSGIKTDRVHYVPGEHDILEDDGRSFLNRLGRGTRGQGWYSFDQNGVHFIGLVNVVDLKAGGLGNLGDEQLEWLQGDLARLSDSTPIVVFAHIPLWSVYPEWGWGTSDAARAMGYLKRFGSVTVLNGHIHQVMQKVEGRIAFHTAMSTAFPQPKPGAAPSPGPLKVPADQLRHLLGITDVRFVPGNDRLAVVDQPLDGPLA
jgi:3',5'-cyclic AMP phosphodiesterase CpdA